MACLIKRNNENKITEVQTPQGTRSKLFDAIHSIPYLAGSETSLEIFKNGYSDSVEESKFETYDTREPKLFFMSEKGNVYNSIEDVIVNKETGKIKAGFRTIDTKEFTPIVSFETSNGEVNQFVTSAIEQGLLSPERVLMPDGSTRYQGKGKDVTTKLAMARATKFDFATENGREGVKVYPDGTLEIKADTAGKATLVNKDGTTSIVRIEDIPEIVKKQNPKNADDLLATYIFHKMNYRPLENSDAPRTSKQIDGLLRNFKTFLESLGFTTTTLEAYRERYNTVYGKDPDIRAIADIANKVVAFAEGSISIESLSEEVAHIAIEFHNDQNSIVSALTNVHLTEEYKEFSEFYRSKYAEFYEGAKLEEQVRKEVLGKILKNEFVDRFSKEGKSAERGYLIDRLREIWSNFVQSIRNVFKPSHTRDLEYLTKKLADNVLELNLGQFDITKEGYDFFYDAMDSKGKGIEKSLITAKAQLEALFQNVIKQKMPNQGELEVIQADMAEIDIVRSFNSLSSVAVSQVNLIEAALRDAENTGKPLSNTDKSRYEALDSLNRTLNTIKSQMKSAKLQNPEAKAKLSEVNNYVEELGRKLNEVGPRMDDYKSSRAIEIIEEELDRLGVSQKIRDKVLAKVAVMERDQSILGKTFGLASQVSNPIINLIAKKAIDMFTRVQVRALTETNPLINKIVDKGWQKFQRSILQRDSKGAATHYFESPILFHLADSELVDKQAELIAKYTELTVEQAKEKLKTLYPRAIIRGQFANEKEASAKYREFSEEMSEWEVEEHLETRFSDKYREDRKKRFDTANVSLATQEYLKNKNLSRFERQRKYMNADKTIDNSKRTEADRYQDAVDKQVHGETKSATVDGVVREGLEIIDSKDLTPQKLQELKGQGRFPKDLTIDKDYKGEVVVLAEGAKIDMLPDASRLSLDLNNLDVFYRQEIKTGDKLRNPNKQFVETLKNLENDYGPQQAYEWLLDNASLTLNDTFYANMDRNVENYEDLVNKYIYEKLDGKKAAEVRENLKELITRQKMRKSILKFHRKANNPLETGASAMSDSKMKRVRDLEAEIADFKKDIALPSEYHEQSVTSETMSDLNFTEDFYNDFEASGKDFVDFVIGHMSISNANSVNEFNKVVGKKVRGQATANRKFDRVINEISANKLINENITIDAVPQNFRDKHVGKTDSEIVDEYIQQRFTEEYAKTKIASYYRRYEPRGYTEVMDALKSGQIKPSVLFSEESSDKAVKESYMRDYRALKYLDLNPDYTWSQDINNEEYNNPNYKAQDYYRQPKLFDKNGKPKYINKAFFEKYGLSIDKFLNDPTGNIFNQTATRNQEQFEFLKEIIELREKELDLYGDAQTVNKWMRPQQHRNNFESLAAIIDPSKKANLKERLKDAFQVRQDEKDYGEVADAKALEESGMSVEVRSVPKYYQTKLQDPSDLTDNVIESVFHSYKQALLYEERIAAEADFNALSYKLGEQKFVSGANGKRKSSIGSKGQVSNYMEMGENYLDYVLYGIKQTRKLQFDVRGRTVDLTQFINTLQAWTRYSNLAYNWIVDATSLTTGFTVNLSDRFSGQFYHGKSANRGNSLTLNVFKYIAEEGKLDKSSEMNSMLEWSGVLKMEDRIKNTSFSRGIRLAAGSGSMMAQISNLGIKPKLMMNVLVDTRFIEGKFRSWPEYYSFKKNSDKTLSRKDIEAEFDKASKESVYDHLDISKDGIKFNDKFKEKFGDKSGEEFMTLTQDIAAKINTMVQITDTVISEADKTVAQRDVLANSLMMHKGWMPINLTKRLKSNHFNFHTGMEDEGHYVTLKNFVIELAKNRGKFSETLKELDPHERANLKRLPVDFAILSSLIGLGMLLFSGDDKDDTYLEDIAQYIALRTAKEVASSDIIGLGRSVVGVAKSPITAIRTIELLEPVSLAKSIFSFDMDEYERLVKGLSPLKRFDQFSDIQKQINSYWYFNKTDIPFQHPIKKEEAKLRKEKKKQKEEREEAANRN